MDAWSQWQNKPPWSMFLSPGVSHWNCSSVSKSCISGHLNSIIFIQLYYCRALRLVLVSDCANAFEFLYFFLNLSLCFMVGENISMWATTLQIVLLQLYVFLLLSVQLFCYKTLLQEVLCVFMIWYVLQIKQ